MSLYRKYRPHNFANLVGQDHIRTTLMNALGSGNVNHAYIFTGPRGTGKTSAARLLAKAVNCLALKDAEACDNCEICRDIIDGRLIDVIEIDAASNRGIDEIRDLKEKIVFAPTRAKNKVYIIDEVHMLTKEAFNALLKTLEEPPAHVFFILATTEAHKVPATILSRCQRFNFKRIDDTVIVERLKVVTAKERIEAEKDSLDAIARYSMGGLRDAIGLLEQLTVNGKLTYERVREVLGISAQTALEQMFDFLQKHQTKGAIDHINVLYANGHDLTQFNKDFLWFLRKKMVEAVETGDNPETMSILRFIKLFQEAHEQLRFSIIPQLPMEVAITIACLGSLQIQGKEKSLEINKKIAVAAVPSQMYKTEMETATAKSNSSAVASRLHQPVRIAASIMPLEQLQQQWPNILKQIKNAIASRTLSMGRLAALEGNILKIGFQNRFNLDKFNEPAHRLALESALFAVLQARLKVVAVLENSQEMDENTTKLMELFGGELVE